MEPGGDEGNGKKRMRDARHTGYDDDDDVDEEEKMEIFCALISSARDHMLNNINIVNGSSSAELLIHSHRAAAAAAPNNKKMKTAVDVNPDYCNNMYKAAPNIINYRHKAAAAAWQPSFQHEDFIRVVDGDNKIQSASRSTTRSPRAMTTSMIMTTRPPPPPVAAAPPPPPLMMVDKQPNGDNKLADHHPKVDGLDLKLSL